MFSRMFAAAVVSCALCLRAASTYSSPGTVVTTIDA
jgi:hypothetical protein